MLICLSVGLKSIGYNCFLLSFIFIISVSLHLIYTCYYGIKTSIRVDPIIPFVNDDINEIEGIIETVHNFCDQVIVSTLKLRPDSIKRFQEKLPDIYKKSYYKEKIRGNLYLDKNYRYKIICNIYNLTKKYDLDFSSCREGFKELNTNICDGSGHIKNSV